MMRFLSFLACLPIIFLFSGCNDDFVINAKWKDITIVYGLLNPSAPDSINYIRINRAFVNEGKDATMIAQIPDSINYTDSLYVVLQEWKFGVYQSGKDIVLSKVPNINKDSGIFTIENQFLYATPALTVFAPSSVYKLVITNTVTGKVISSETTIVGNIESVFPRPGNKITITSRNDIDFIWFSGKNSYFYDFDAVIYYHEFKRSFPEDKVLKTINWPLGKSLKTKTDEGNDEMKVSVDGINFFRILKDNIKIDPAIDREFLRIDFIYSAGGEEIFNYINVNKPSISTVQKKPEYTNIVNGLGVFSSRNQNILKIQITPTTLTELQTNELTQELNFIR